MSALGDVALASAAVEALASRAETLLVTASEFAGLYVGDPRLVGVVEVDRAHRDRAHRDRARDAIRAFGPEVVVDLQDTTRSRRIRSGVEVRQVVTAPRDAVRRRLLLARLGFAAPAPRRVLDRYRLAVGEVLGGPVDAEPRLHVTPSAEAWAAAVLPGERWVGVAPGAAWGSKRWPIRRYLALARLAREREIQVAVVVGPGDELERRAFGEAFGHDPGVRVIDEPLDRLPAALARLRVLVTGDSGPLHVAEAVGTPVVALFGPTVPAFGFAPWRPESKIVERQRWCRPCHIHGGHRCPLGHHRCLTTISESEVFNEVHPRVEAGPIGPLHHATSGGTENGGNATCHSGRHR